MKIKSAAALATALALSGCASAPPRMDAATSLAAAESAFAAHSVREDMRVAFLANFAPDGVFVRNGWTNALEWLRDRTAPPIVLDWRPQYVEVAASGELGLSTGPWEITSKAKPEAAPQYGQFVSVWRREGGAWKVAVDLGISHPAEALWKAPLEARAHTASAAGGPSLEQAEARFAADARERGLRAAYGAHGADNLHFYRSGYAPLTSRTAALASAALMDEKVTWTIERSETARSGDFAYARGAYLAQGNAAPLGWFTRVWRREGGAWRIVMDVVTPAPQKP
jgi:ketosteroid isomerase-like protein